MAQQDLPPQGTRIALFAAGGAFGGTLLAMLLFWLLTGGFCCDDQRVSEQKSAISPGTALSLETIPLHA